MSAPDTSSLTVLAPAIFGLLGVFVGAVLATLKELWFGYRNDGKNARYLAVQVVGQLVS